MVCDKSINIGEIYNDAFSHTQLTFLRVFIIWELVSTSNIGHHQASVQDINEWIQKLSTMR